MTPSVIEKIFVYPSLRKRQLEFPLLPEREQFLLHSLEHGTSIHGVRSLATMLLHIVQIMELTSLHMISLPEIDRASLEWMSAPGFYKGRRPGGTSRRTFAYTAVRFFTFHKVMQTVDLPLSANEIILRNFRHYLKEERGMKAETSRGYCSSIKSFLNVATNPRKALSDISLQDVDEFLQKKTEDGFSPHSLVAYSMALRLFFQYGEIRGLTSARIAGGIQNARIARPDSVPKGPKWKDVRRMLNYKPGDKPSDLRAAAIISLCSIYGMRSIEVVSLMLHDFDWVSEVLIVVRAKGGRIQQLPIQFEVGETILRYLQYGRPRCTCRNLFVTLRPPYRPVRSATIWGIVADRMKYLEIESAHFGGHSLRHSCATELLRKGSSLRDVADFLGHRSMNAISTYAKYDMRSLRQIAKFSLAGVR